MVSLRNNDITLPWLIYHIIEVFYRKKSCIWQQKQQELYTEEFKAARSVVVECRQSAPEASKRLGIGCKWIEQAIQAMEKHQSEWRAKTITQWSYWAEKEPGTGRGASWNAATKLRRYIQ